MKTPRKESALKRAKAVADAKANAIAPPTDGVCSLGLKTIVFPANSAGTICPLGKCPGILNGPSTAATPCGLNRVIAFASPEP